MSTYHDVPKRATRYRQPHAADVQVDTEELPAQQEEKKQDGCLTPLLIGAAIVLLAYVGWTGLVVPTATNVSDNFTYGQARISETVADVGHGGQSTFVGLVENNQIVVIELVGNPLRHMVYVVGTTTDTNTPVVTLSFQDVNGDGKPDMLVHIGSQTVVWINDKGIFRPVQASDHISV
jgi:hypothetical protein